MMKLQHILCVSLLVFPTTSWGWGEPASATTTLEARVTNWTENPCDYGDRFAEACEYAKQHNLFPESAQPTEPQGGWTSSLTTEPTTTTVTDYGSFKVETTTTNYE